MEWISVDDRLPEQDSTVKFSLYLAIHKDWDNHCRLLMFNNDTLEFTRDGDDTQKVTHWMPLPESPENTT